MATTEPIRDQSQLHALADHFLKKGEFLIESARHLYGITD